MKPILLSFLILLSLASQASMAGNMVLADGNESQPSMAEAMNCHEMKGDSKADNVDIEISCCEQECLCMASGSVLVSGDMIRSIEHFNRALHYIYDFSLISSDLSLLDRPPTFV